jgi:fumarylacetoacetase
MPSVHNYTDFYASIHHAATVGSMFRPDNPLLPNYRHVPIGYHGRASSIVVSGTEVRRSRGQIPPPDDKPGQGPTFGPCRMLDYELEVGAFVGPGNNLGEPVPIGRAEDHIFGLCLVNDWSARDIQKWEYQPLGPFLAKNFATTISPYVVALEALEPFRCPAYRRPAGDPRPLDYLYDEQDQARGGFDITLEVWLRSAEMERRGMSPVRLSRSNAFREMYWTFAQMLAHHTSNGCNLQPGDLLASGTVSGTGPAERGCLLELTWQGRGPDAKPLPRKPIELPTGEKRVFLEDGDEVIFKGYCERDGFRRIGFGECRGKIVPAKD